MGYNMKNSPINKGYAAKPSPAKSITLAAIGAAIGKFAATAAGKAVISGAAGAVVNKAAGALSKGDIGKQNDPFGGVKMGNPITQRYEDSKYGKFQKESLTLDDGSTDEKTVTSTTADKNSKPKKKLGKRLSDLEITKTIIKAGVSKLISGNEGFKPINYASNFSKMQLGTYKNKKA